MDITTAKSAARAGCTIALSGNYSFILYFQNDGGRWNTPILSPRPETIVIDIAQPINEALTDAVAGIDLSMDIQINPFAHRIIPAPGGMISVDIDSTFVMTGALGLSVTPAIVTADPVADRYTGFVLEPAILAPSADLDVEFGLGFILGYPYLRTAIDITADLGIGLTAEPATITALVPNPVMALVFPMPTAELGLGCVLNYHDLSVALQDPEVVYPRRLKSGYKCFIGNIVLPISAVQITLRNGTYSFVQVTVPTLDYMTQINNNLDRDLIVYFNYYLDGVLLSQYVLASAIIDTITVNQTGSSESVNLAGSWVEDFRAGLDEGGHPIGDAPPPNNVYINDNNVVDMTMINGSQTLTLARVDINAKPGDYITHNGAVFTSSSIIYNISPTTNYFAIE